MVFESRHNSVQEAPAKRLRLDIHGAVQGVGFRPFVYRLASELGLRGWVENTGHGVTLEVDGEDETLRIFRARLENEKPPLSFISAMETSWLDPGGFHDLRIRESATNGTPRAFVLPDIATCPECLREMLSPINRRFLYPFINCTNCGPRFSIIETLPYDRPNTSMKKFGMCPECRHEYEDPLNRRFHAQPNACPQCGPHLELWDRSGNAIAMHHGAIETTARMIRRGAVIAMKGIGGFQLLVDARNQEAVAGLRIRKHREEKPFAVMFPSLDMVRRECDINEMEKQVLLSPQSPIVLLGRNLKSIPSDSAITPGVAPGNPNLGVMLPYSPLHHLLMRELGFPVVATSGNISDEPMCIEEREALDRLHSVADAFLVHNRPIVRHVDDSVVRVLLGREQVLRRARGYAPLPVSMKHLGRPVPFLAVGAHLKNAVALSVHDNIFVSQHIGDLETGEAFDAFRRVIRDFRLLYDCDHATVVSDLHPDYLSTQYALGLCEAGEQVQHHHAHVCSCMAENDLEGEVLGVSWDGTGYGPDGTVWGGEFLIPNDSGFSRLAAMRPFRLPGGEQAIREPRKVALGVLFAVLGEGLFAREDIPLMASFQASEKRLLHQMLVRGIRSPMTSSAGRLFDAVAAMLGVRDIVHFEGQAAMELEFAVDRSVRFQPYPFAIIDEDPRTGSDGTWRPEVTVDWGPMVQSILDEIHEGSSRGVLAARFHHTLAAMILRVAEKAGLARVVLTGGCFQNKYLTEQTVQILSDHGFRTYWHQRIPPNDGGIALGQIAAVLHRRGPRQEVAAGYHRPEHASVPSHSIMRSIG